ncbi:MAG: histidinol dehydrogenase, partial [Acidimicrobiia bacterium]|nr:histidinol dehydrogenase [Acidimicrobiia bacterium]
MPRLRNVNYEAMTAADRRLLLARSAVPDRSVRDGAVAICDDVAERGDVAVSEYAERFGGGFRRVTNAEVDAACNASPPGLISALEAAAGNVEAFHRAQLPRDLSVETVEGVQIVRKWTPLRRVGAYVPGGKAAYPSTVIMTAVPARVAGVEEVVVASPAADDGTVDPAVLAACRVA